jgi:hypothetical protein
MSASVDRIPSTAVVRFPSFEASKALTFHTSLAISNTPASEVPSAKNPRTQNMYLKIGYWMQTGVRIDVQIQRFGLCKLTCRIIKTLTRGSAMSSAHTFKLLHLELYPGYLLKGTCSASSSQSGCGSASRSCDCPRTTMALILQMQGWGRTASDCRRPVCKATLGGILAVRSLAATKIHSERGSIWIR